MRTRICDCVCACYTRANETRTLLILSHGYTLLMIAGDIFQSTWRIHGNPPPGHDLSNLHRSITMILFLRIDELSNCVTIIYAIICDEMEGTIPCKTVKENDLVVTINANVKVSEQSRIAACNGNQSIEMIRRNITEDEEEVIVPLYKAIVIPILEYCILALGPYLREGKDLLDKIQRRPTNLIPWLIDLSYK